MRLLPALLPLATWLLAACGGAGTGAAPPRTTHAPAAPPRPCDLAEGHWTLRVPVPPNHALAASDDACLLIDEGRDATFASLASLSADAEGADLLAQDPDEFFRASGLLGPAPRPLGRAQWTLLGARVAATRWAADLEGIGPREVHTAALRRGPYWLLIMTVSPPGDADAARHLERLLAQIELP